LSATPNGKNHREPPDGRPLRAVPGANDVPGLDPGTHRAPWLDQGHRHRRGKLFS
jgi:hypothetical protein